MGGAPGAANPGYVTIRFAAIGVTAGLPLAVVAAPKTPGNSEPAKDSPPGPIGFIVPVITDELDGSSRNPRFAPLAWRTNGSGGTAGVAPGLPSIWTVYRPLLDASAA